MIIFPMAGQSRRFFDAGYDRPKYELPLWGQTVFDHVLQGFSALFEAEPFLFIARQEAQPFLERRLAALGLGDAELVLLDHATHGQADTVRLGLDHASVSPSTPLTIFNIDTLHRQFTYPVWLGDCDGYLEVFEGPGTHWSFVLPDGPARARQVAEKDRISDLCSSGLYYFARAELFLNAWAQAHSGAGKGETEHYIAPLYNELIKAGCDIRYDRISLDRLAFCGTPQDYEVLAAREVDS